MYLTINAVSDPGKPLPSYVILQDGHGAVQTVGRGCHMEGRAFGGATDPKLPGIKHVELIDPSIVGQQCSHGRQAVGGNGIVQRGEA